MFAIAEHRLDGRRRRRRAPAGSGCGPCGRRPQAEQLRRGLLVLHAVQHVARLADCSSQVVELLLQSRHRALCAPDSIGQACSSSGQSQRPRVRQPSAAHRSGAGVPSARAMRFFSGNCGLGEGGACCGAHQIRLALITSRPFPGAVQTYCVNSSTRELRDLRCRRCGRPKSKCAASESLFASVSSARDRRGRRDRGRWRQ